MSDIDTLTTRLEELEQKLAHLHHPCMSRVEDLQAVIIWLTNEKCDVLERQLKASKKAQKAIAPLDAIANSIEFGHSHES